MALEAKSERVWRDRLPPQGAIVEAMCRSTCGQQISRVRSRWTECGWVSAKTLRPLGKDVIGWRSR